MGMIVKETEKMRVLDVCSIKERKKEGWNLMMMVESVLRKETNDGDLRRYEFIGERMRDNEVMMGRHTINERKKEGWNLKMVVESVLRWRVVTGEDL